MKRVALTTFGCRANQYDTAALAQNLRASEMNIVDFGEDADVVIINSCAITHQADRDARQMIYKARRKNPGVQIIVTGCAAQVDPDIFKKEGVDFVIGNDEKGKIAEMIAGDVGATPRGRPGQPQGAAPTGDSDIFYTGGVLLEKHSRSFLKIQDGCSQFCSFCIVPFARGLNRSIKVDQVLQSIHELKAKGLTEVVLTGIHLGTYGKDLLPQTSLLALLQRIEAEKPIDRVRLSSIDPEEVTDELIDFMASSQVFCPHFHLPLQSGDNEVLKRMRRRYTAEHFLKITHQIKSRLPDACIGTDVIVGFPGEGDAAFENTLYVVQESALSYIHVFPYSPRKGTKAYSFENQVDEKVKKERSKRLRLLSDQKRFFFQKQFEGQILEVVLEKRKKGLVGMTRNYISVEIDSHSMVRQAHHVHLDKIGHPELVEGSDLSQVVITRVTPEAVLGSLMEPQELSDGMAFAV